MLWSNQLRGSHALFGGAEFGWRGNWSLATRDQPDFRRTRYDLDPVGNIFYLSSRPEGNQRLFNELDDEGLDLAADLKVPVPLGHGVEASVRGGAGWIHRSREAQTRRYKFQHVGPRASDPAVLSRPAEDIFTPENIGPDGFELQEITRATDAYEAEQELTSFFGMAELKLSNGLELVGGVRVESSRQEVRTFNIFSPGQEQVAELDTTDPLPAVNAAWRFMEGWQVRTGYSRTLSRPDFRELSEAPYDQVIGGGVVVGNPELQRATIDNYDVRLEWYPSEAESVSVGLFYKGLDQPIETVLVGGSNRTTTYENAESAKVFGLELEFRKGLGFASDLLRNWSFSGNLALIGSKVEISNPGIATEDQRPLQGQSPYVLNLAFGYDDPEAGLSAALLYNVSGPRISEIGVSGLPDVYEQPFHQLDFVASWTINANFSVKLKVRNLLDGMQEFTQEGEPTLSYRKGMDVTLGVSWSY
jgi:TonB-dependent receptor